MFLEDLDVDIKTLIIKVLVNLVTHQIVQSTTNEASRSYESAMSYVTFVDNSGKGSNDINGVLLNLCI